MWGDLRMLFLQPPENAAGIRNFCRQFNENIHVEYKQNFDGNVRNSLAKIVSSFANSLGGVLILGVSAPNGVPVESIEGFDKPNDELRLTIQNICLQSLNPPVLPKIMEVESDTTGEVFVVIEIAESEAASHAIENRTKVYVRTEQDKPTSTNSTNNISVNCVEIMD